MIFIANRTFADTWRRINLQQVTFAVGLMLAVATAVSLGALGKTSAQGDATTLPAQEARVVRPWTKNVQVPLIYHVVATEQELLELQSEILLADYQIVEAGGQPYAQRVQLVRLVRNPDEQAALLDEVWSLGQDGREYSVVVKR